jgi:hypothetical protein
MAPTAFPFEALRGGATCADAFDTFDHLPSVTPAAIRGRWVGHELATGHSWDGKLTAAGWQGKEFRDDDAVHPLLFGDRHGNAFPVDPRWVPVALVDKLPVRSVVVMGRAIGWLRPLIRARQPGARLRMVVYRGTASAAMVYDQLPIIDVFRRVDQDTLLGVMDMRGTSPYFFYLVRA